jgi:hypothetical protein
MNFQALIECAASEIPELWFGAGLADAIRFLDLPGELGVLTRNRVKVVVGKPAPLYFHLALFPIIRNRIPIHNNLL